MYDSSQGETSAMVDFRKRLVAKTAKTPINPVELYDTLDRAHDKGPLRPAQLAILEEWHSNHRNARDVIVKLHTGQGKTLIGLLILQARLNENQEPVVYLCPDNFLVDQVCEQAKQFGIATCTVDSELPDDFVDGARVLVTSVHKLFNGLTKFGLNNASTSVGTVLMDDAHACADIIRDQCCIRIPSNEPVYNEILNLFAADLEGQGAGTWADIKNGKKDALLPVPYWAWMSRETDVASKLSKVASSMRSVKFAWPLVKDMLSHCQCIVSGGAAEIEPYIPPLMAFGSYWKASHRVFMSATVTDDAFLVKGLQLAPESIAKPLSYDKETWSGEKMILLPSLIHEDMTREQVVEWFGKPSQRRKFGVVALAPSFARTKDWEQYGAKIARKESVGSAVDELRRGQHQAAVVLVNRYDGVDLPDDACRILIFDGRPYTESLTDRYQELCRPDSESTLMRTVRSIEQGMGRSVRGEKDYCVVMGVGTDLVRMLRDRTTRKYFSSQMVTQINLGFEIAGMAGQEIEEDNKDPKSALQDLIVQCLRRDPGWKEFYAYRMNDVVPSGANETILQTYAAELAAEKTYAAGDYATAVKGIQEFLDATKNSDEDRGWYLQEMARYHWRTNRTESERLQIAAHRKNRLLLKPRNGVTVAKLEVVSQRRMERIGDWVSDCESYAELDAKLADILDSLVFGAKADRFESALNELSQALGFNGERPDKEWKEGPDNLWALDAKQYLLWECKNEVDVTRAEINKREAEQMNRSSAWFDKYYHACSVKRFLVHPANRLQSAAAFTHEVEVVRESELRKLVRAVQAFFRSFELLDFRDLSTAHTQSLINSHGLTVQHLLSNYSTRIRQFSVKPSRSTSG